MKDSYLLMDDEIDRKIDVTAILLVQNIHHTHDWTLIGSGANDSAVGIQYEYQYLHRQIAKIEGL